MIYNLAVVGDGLAGIAVGVCAASRQESWRFLKPSGFNISASPRLAGQAGKLPFS